ncbi:MAG: hypothetical protein QOD75_2315 [Blastocatellia bacterium]|nr:hypothetical protein [Blastocatellia bacterium]
MNEVGAAFIAKARDLLVNDYLPKIERCCERLTDQQIWQRPNAESNSIGNLVLHLSGNLRQWIVCGVGDSSDARNRSEEFAERRLIPRDELLERIRETVREADSALAQMDLNVLVEQRVIQSCEVKVLDAIFHAVEHFSMHTGQIILLTKMVTGSDLKFYEFSGGVPAANWKS